MFQRAGRTCHYCPRVLTSDLHRTVSQRRCRIDMMMLLLLCLLSPCASMHLGGPRGPLPKGVFLDNDGHVRVVSSGEEARRKAETDRAIDGIALPEPAAPVAPTTASASTSFADVVAASFGDAAGSVYDVDESLVDTGEDSVQAYEFSAQIPEAASPLQLTAHDAASTESPQPPSVETQNPMPFEDWSRTAEESFFRMLCDMSSDLRQCMMKMRSAVAESEDAFNTLALVLERWQCNGKDTSTLIAIAESYGIERLPRGQRASDRVAVARSRSPRRSN